MKDYTGLPGIRAHMQEPWTPQNCIYMYTIHNILICNIHEYTCKIIELSLSLSNHLKIKIQNCMYSISSPLLSLSLSIGLGSSLSLSLSLYIYMPFLAMLSRTCFESEFDSNQPAGANSQAQSRCSGILGLTDSQDHPIPCRSLHLHLSA